MVSSNETKVDPAVATVELRNNANIGPPRAEGTTSLSERSAEPAPAKRTADDFLFGRQIGEGSFSVVYLAKDVYKQKEFASK